MSEDLSYFDHIHPQIAANGSYTVKHKFPTPGKYILFADYKPKGFNHMVDRLYVEVVGKGADVTTYNSEKLSCNVDNYKVALSPEGGNFIAGSPTHLVAAVTQNGKAIDPNTFQNYLGAKAHMVVISLKDKEYMHVHPNVISRNFDLHTTFEKPGIYRGWIQFKTNNIVHTFDFLIRVNNKGN